MLKRPMCAIGLAVVVIIYLLLCVLRLPSPPGEEDVHEGQYISLTGQVTQKEYKNHQFVLHLEKVHLQNSSELSRKTYSIIAYFSEDPQLLLGSRASVTGKCLLFACAENEGQFDQARYQKINGVDFALTGTRVTAKGIRYHRWEETLYQCREHLKAVYDRCLPQKEAGILHALLLGDKTSLDQEVKELYTRAGIVHILSLSGLHIATAGLCLLKLLRRLKLPLLAASLLSALFIIQYGIMTGLQTSTLRALVMFLLSIIAMCLGRTYDLLSATTFAAILLLLENPLYLFHTGFLLSFGAVMGIGLVYPSLMYLIPRRFQRKKLLQSVLISVSVQLATLPIVLDAFFQISICGILLNLIVVPLMTLVLAVGVIGGGAGLMSDIVGTLVLYPCRLILLLYEWLSKLAVKLPGSIWITGKPERWQAVSYYLILVVLLVMLTFIKSKYKYNQYRKIRTLRIITIFVMSTMTVILIYRNREPFTVTMLSVGQGECTVMHGTDVPTVMIDGGSTDVSEVGKYRMIPYLKSNRLHRIDTVFISHTDTDHVSGIIEILQSPEEGVRIRQLILPAIDTTLQNEQYLQLIQSAKAAGTRVYTMKKDDQMKLWKKSFWSDATGEDEPENQTLIFRCLSPSDTTIGDLNEHSVVLDVNYVNLKMLFTGDISSSVESKLIESISTYTILKIPHHGSRFSGSEAFLQVINPSIALISAGRNNSYGHPHEETIKRLAQIGSKVLRTDQCGEIDITFTEDGIGLDTFLDDS